MKKAIFGLLVLAILVMSLSVSGNAVVADKGGNPNQNACYGQIVKGYAQDGGLGQYRNNEGPIKNTDWNGDGKTNGQDLAWLIKYVKETC